MQQMIDQIQQMHQYDVQKLENEIGKLAIANPIREIGQLPS